MYSQLVNISRKTIYCSFILLFFITTSCVSKKKINYFQDNAKGDTTKVEKNINASYTPVFQNDDFLSIDISSMDVESIKPFVTERGISPTSSVQSGYTSGSAAKTGYLIDANGDIDFPIIGKIHLAGLNRMEATELLKTKLSEYISLPVVNIRIQNFKITVLGDVNSPGTFNIPNERITIVEALGIAGDLNITGVRKNILVIRDIDGVKKEFRLDLSSNKIFQSPAYYLSQNDVVYVEPNGARRNSSLITSTTGVFISIASLIITTVTLIVR